MAAGPGSKSGRARFARSTNSSEAAPGSRAGMGQSCSPGRRNGARLVAMTVTPEVSLRRVRARDAAPSATCSQVSSTRSRSPCRHSLLIVSVADAPGGTRIPAAPATAGPTCSSAERPDRPQKTVPSLHRASEAAGRASQTRRVLPIPAGPTMVRRRDRPSMLRKRSRAPESM